MVRFFSLSLDAVCGGDAPFADHTARPLKAQARCMERRESRSPISTEGCLKERTRITKDQTKSAGVPRTQEPAPSLGACRMTIPRPPVQEGETGVHV